MGPGVHGGVGCSVQGRVQASAAPKRETCCLQAHQHAPTRHAHPWCRGESGHLAGRSSSGRLERERTVAKERRCSDRCAAGPGACPGAHPPRLPFVQSPSAASFSDAWPPLSPAPSPLLAPTPRSIRTSAIPPPPAPATKPPRAAGKVLPLQPPVPHPPAKADCATAPPFSGSPPPAAVPLSWRRRRTASHTTADTRASAATPAGAGRTPRATCHASGVSRRQLWAAGSRWANIHTGHRAYTTLRPRKGCMHGQSS